MLYLLPPLAAPTGVDGAVQSQSGGGIRAQAAAAQLGPLGLALIGTLLCMALVGTGAYGTRVESVIPLPEATVFKVAANTTAERNDEERLFSGYMRLRAGQPRNPAITYGTGRGMVEDAVLLYNGRAADLALHVQTGEAMRLMRNTSGATLGEVARSNLWRVEVQGQMAPRGGALLVATGAAGGGDLLARILLAALLALAAAAFAFWGSAAGRALPASTPLGARALVILLPIAGAATALLSPLLGLGPLALLITGVVVGFAALLLLLRSQEVAGLDR